MRHIKQWRYLANVQKMTQIDLITNAFRAAACLTQWTLPPLTGKDQQFNSAWIQSEVVATFADSGDASTLSDLESIAAQAGIQVI